VSRINMLRIPLFLLLVLAIPSNSFGSNSGSFTDNRDGQEYKWIEIDSQIWMAENLNYEVYYNYYNSVCYDNDNYNCEKYGRLYDWSAAETACPEGWHLPSNDEWDILTTAVGGEETAGTMLKSSDNWYDEDYNYIPGNDDYGFSALPGGEGGSNGYSGAGQFGAWWSSTEDYGNGGAYYRRMDYNYENVGWNSIVKEIFLSVRCIWD